MSEKRLLDSLRTWIEIDSRAARINYNIFRKIIEKKVLLWAVVKSNAYGHGLVVFSQLMEKIGVDGFCVDSVVEGIALRKAGIKKFILVLGSTLPERFEEAADNKITISISNIESFKKLSQIKNCPDFHIKIDTGMHRQGFYLEDIPNLIKNIKKSNLQTQKSFKGIFTHFASAKDINYPTYTDLQFEKMQKAKNLFSKEGFSNLIVHSSATGGALINKKYHCDAVRIGIGLYGMWPSKELEIQLGDKIRLKPILSWRAVISEIKHLRAGDYIGYDLAEKIHHSINSAVLPVGYWHGLYRSLSSNGEVLINGKRAKILGRVSMDMISVGVNGSVSQGDIATLIGKDGKDEIFAWELAQKTGTSHYEIVTRLNPLIERIII